ncbi:translin-associated X [Pelobates cultripes]|uniref:Translin-associated protein X n=1 Tax=Pelobates cultripes TaxID=61616 RepID=A0AAD1VSW0_PELCU|nr:translin-associated X [Pelobates cultripes]
MNEKEGSCAFKKHKHENVPRSQRKEEKGSGVGSSSSMVIAFKSFQHELDTKHDKYERLVKLGRDITIESKRTIFILHRIISDPNKDGVLTEAENKLDVVRLKIKQVAQELVGEDLYQYNRAFTPGLQEYVEAVTFQHFIKTRCLLCLEDINKPLIFEEEKSDVKSTSIELLDDPLIPVLEKKQSNPNILSLQVTPVDYLLGVADLTGELMRLCIGSVGNGDIDTPFELGQFLREIFDGFSYIGNTGPYEISRKLYALKQSLAKVENACYTLKVRGSEIPKHMLADLFSTKSELMEHDEDIS